MADPLLEQDRWDDAVLQIDAADPTPLYMITPHAERSSVRGDAAVARSPLSGSLGKPTHPSQPIDGFGSQARAERVGPGPGQRPDLPFHVGHHRWTGDDQHALPHTRTRNLPEDLPTRLQARQTVTPGRQGILQRKAGKGKQDIGFPAVGGESLPLL